MKPRGSCDASTVLRHAMLPVNCGCASGKI